jgi:hypothetical protein
MGKQAHTGRVDGVYDISKRLRGLAIYRMQFHLHLFIVLFNCGDSPADTDAGRREMSRLLPDWTRSLTTRDARHAQGL